MWHSETFAIVVVFAFSENTGTVVSSLLLCTVFLNMLLPTTPDQCRLHFEMSTQAAAISYVWIAFSFMVIV